MVDRGIFIVFEGGEGSGKSTQVERLRQGLSDSGHRAITVREPGTTTLGGYLREYLKSKRALTPESELLLFVAARAQLVAEEIRPTLEKGISVISDRYTGSTVAYQGFGRGVSREAIDFLNEFVTGGLTPDITFLLDVEPGQGLTRVGSPQLTMALMPDEHATVGREDIAGHRRYEDQSISFHNRVRRGYLELAKSHEGWQVMDGSLSVEELSGQIWQAVRPLLSEKTRETPTALDSALAEAKD